MSGGKAGISSFKRAQATATVYTELSCHGPLLNGKGREFKLQGRTNQHATTPKLPSTETKHLES